MSHSQDLSRYGITPRDGGDFELDARALDAQRYARPRIASAVRRLRPRRLPACAQTPNAPPLRVAFAYTDAFGEAFRRFRRLLQASRSADNARRAAKLGRYVAAAAGNALDIGSRTRSR